MIPTQSLVGDDDSIELPALGTAHEFDGLTLPQKKTSGGVAPIHLRKCATASESRLY
jgi:hypothetical protein